MSELGHVWTAPWQELSDVSAALVGCGPVQQNLSIERANAFESDQPLRGSMWQIEVERFFDAGLAAALLHPHPGFDALKLSVQLDQAVADREMQYVRLLDLVLQRRRADGILKMLVLDPEPPRAGTGRDDDRRRRRAQGAEPLGGFDSLPVFKKKVVVFLRHRGPFQLPLQKQPFSLYVLISGTWNEERQPR